MARQYVADGHEYQEMTEFELDGMEYRVDHGVIPDAVEVRRVIRTARSLLLEMGGTAILEDQFEELKRKVEQLTDAVKERDEELEEKSQELGRLLGDRAKVIAELENQLKAKTDEAFQLRTKATFLHKQVTGSEDALAELDKLKAENKFLQNGLQEAEQELALLRGAI